MESDHTTAVIQTAYAIWIDINRAQMVILENRISGLDYVGRESLREICCFCELDMVHRDSRIEEWGLSTVL